MACRLVKDGKADAVVSAGHSGATVACGMFIMGRLPGVERPALAALLPTEKNPVVVLDAGANVDCRPYHLFQFGLMGDAFARDLLGYAAPRVSLLSIGEEEGKGNSQVKEAYELLKLAQNLNFVGNAEGRDIFTGDIDVVVCDGFVGNVVVKMSEGLASALVRMLKRLFTSGFLPALGGMLAKGAFKKFATTIDYAEYGGAPSWACRAWPSSATAVPAPAPCRTPSRWPVPSCARAPTTVLPKPSWPTRNSPASTRHLSHGYFYEAKLLPARPQQPCSRRGPDQRRPEQTGGDQRRVDHHPYRHQASPPAFREENASDLGTHAARKALENAGLDAARLTHILTATCTPDHLSPSLSCIIGGNIGAGPAMSFDFGSACSGFLYGLHLADALLCQDPASQILFVCTEALTRRVNWSDRSTCVLFGDGAGACILNSDPENALARVQDSICKSDGSLHDLIIVGGGTSCRYKPGDPVGDDFFITMQGREVYSMPCARCPASARELLARNGLTAADASFRAPPGQHAHHRGRGQPPEDRSRIMCSPMWPNTATPLPPPCRWPWWKPWPRAASRPGTVCW